ncbi:hypothetical protein [Saccharothrix xinjiangensis]|uniref:DUF4062 domain-containing protein n=1 Tax=Saccharothrix xinjiangensis TaxID=204798 RepID=A0ABV9Y3X2_9PSEU
MGDSRRITVFVSSPGDVAEERAQCGRVVEELNTILGALAPERDVRLELVRWETHTHPDLGDHPQRVVDEQLGADFDVFVGIMWSRFGTPTWLAGSGTEHEFRDAHAGWRARRRPAHVLFYFCEAPVDDPDDGEREAILAFRRELERIGLVGVYDDRAAFADKVRRDLVLVLGRILHGHRRPAGAVSGADLEIARARVTGPAAEYDRVRETTAPGPDRTRRLEVVASTLRTLARSTSPLLPELVASGSAGTRLAAVCALQALPDVRYLDWLARRFDGDQPFIAYHAGMALLTAARELSAVHPHRLAGALELAEALVARLSPTSDRATAVRAARVAFEEGRSP